MTDEFPPTDAVEALSEIEGYRETLALRVFGLNLMVFGIAIAAIPITYAAGGSWLAEQAGGSLAVSLLWAPWIAGAVAVSMLLWSTFSMTIDETQRPALEILVSLGFTLVFFLLAGGLLVAGPDLGTYVVMSLATGLLTAVIGLYNFLRYGARRMLLAMMGAAIVIALLALGIHTLGLPPAGEALTTGFAQGATYVLVGWVLVYRG